MTDWRHTTTERLWLDLAVEDDLDDLFAIHADPATWRHLPSGRHTERESTAALVASDAERFRVHGLGCWSVRESEDGPVVGRGGCTIPSDDDAVALPWWNLYYRFAPSVQGRGYATEMGWAAIAAARDVDPDRSVLALLLEHNLGSRRTAERLGLSLVWRGPDAGNPDPDAVRLVFLDRAPTPEVMAAIEGRTG